MNPGVENETVTPGASKEPYESAGSTAQVSGPEREDFGLKACNHTQGCVCVRTHIYHIYIYIYIFKYMESMGATIQRNCYMACKKRDLPS